MRVRIQASVFLLFLVYLHLTLVSSSATPRDLHLRKTSEADDAAVRDKKKNIPLVPKPNEGVPGLTSLPLKYSGGKHPVLHEFISDHPVEELVGTKKDTVMQPPATAFVDPYASSIIPNKEEAATETVSHKSSKRFELYPKWFSNKVPSIFGKRFSKNYYYPFDGNVVKSRDTIARSPHHIGTVRGRHTAHSLPMSYMQAAPAPIHIQNGVGRRRRQHAMAMMPIGVSPSEIYGNQDVAASPYGGSYIDGGVIGQNQFGNAAFGGDVGPGGAMNLPNEPYQPSFMGNGGYQGYPMRRVPYGLMQRMNPDMYQPSMPGKLRFTNELDGFTL